MKGLILIRLKINGFERDGEGTFSQFPILYERPWNDASFTIQCKAMAQDNKTVLDFIQNLFIGQNLESG